MALTKRQLAKYSIDGHEGYRHEASACDRQRAEAFCSEQRAERIHKQAHSKISHGHRRWLASVAKNQHH
jgi:hypothetical protein